MGEKDEKDKAMDAMFSWKVPMPVKSVIRGKKEKAKGKSKKKKKRSSKRLLSQKDNEDIAKGIISGNYLLPATDKKEEMRSKQHAQIHEAACCFAERHADYYQKRMIDWRARLEQNAGAMGCFSKAVATADLLECTIDDFISSQFWWFHEVFTRTPRYKEIAGPKSEARYHAWVKAQAEGRSADNVRYPAVMGVMDTKKAKKEAVLSYENKILRRMLQQWESEDVVWEMFGDPNDEEVFSLEFKYTRPKWRDMYMQWYRFRIVFSVNCARGGDLLSSPREEVFIEQCFNPTRWAKAHLRNKPLPDMLITRSHNQPEYRLISVEVLSSDTLPADHLWEKTEPPLLGKRAYRPLWEVVCCKRCRVTGRRDVQDGTVARDGIYKSEIFADCGVVCRRKGGQS